MRGVSQPQRVGVVAQRVPPAGQPVLSVGQLQRADAGVVAMGERHARSDVPALQILFAGGLAYQATVRNNQPPVGKMQSCVQIQLQPGLDGFFWSEARRLSSSFS